MIATRSSSSSSIGSAQGTSSPASAPTVVADLQRPLVGSPRVGRYVVGCSRSRPRISLSCAASLRATSITRSTWSTLPISSPIDTWLRPSFRCRPSLRPDRPATATSPGSSVGSVRPADGTKPLPWPIRRSLVRFTSCRRQAPTRRHANPTLGAARMTKRPAPTGAGAVLNRAILHVDSSAHGP